MHITGTHINYYQICHRKLWLFANGINMESTSDLVYEGKLIHETSYLQRSHKYQEIAIEGIKIDYFDAKNKVVHEIKKSDRCTAAHQWQLKYYLLVLERNGMPYCTGILEYPKLRKKDEVFLTAPDRDTLLEMQSDIYNIIHQDTCPKKIQSPNCKKCSYYDFCYSSE